MFNELEQVERCLRIYKERLEQPRPIIAGYALREWQSSQRLLKKKVNELEKRKKELEKECEN